MMNPEMMKMASEMMSKMTPEQASRDSGASGGFAHAQPVTQPLHCLLVLKGSQHQLSAHTACLACICHFCQAAWFYH